VIERKTLLIDLSDPKKNWLDAWHVNPSNNRDYDFIDGLRGVAMLMVLFGHHFYYNPKAGSTVHFIGGIFSFGGYGVMLFFALSGFLISWPFWQRKVKHAEHVVPSGYGWRRFWKIYPPLALSIVIFTPIYIFRRQDWSYITTASQWLMGLPFIMPVSGKLNPVMWTLVVEVQFYILLPIVFLFLNRASPKICLWIVTLVFLIAPVSAHFAAGFSPTFYPDINSYFPSALDGFYLGILMAGMENMKMLKKSWAWLGNVGLVLLLLAPFVMGWLTVHPEQNGSIQKYVMDWLVKIAAGCLLCYVANPQAPVARLLCMPWLRWCGIISYEWYLFHQPIILWNRETFGPAIGSIPKYAAIVGGSMMASLIIAAMVYRFFSLPILKYGRVKAIKS
jgi:peptidoglycan/LPS O-acetylase OafA/YrhL